MKFFLPIHRAYALCASLSLIPTFYVQTIEHGTHHTKLLPIRINYSDSYPRIKNSYVPVKKEYCFILYMAGDNDLRNFLYRNIDEMQSLLKKLPAQTNFHLFIHTDTHNPGQPKKTLHLINDNNALMQVGETLCMDSGREDTLVFTIEQAIHYCPAEKIILGLWNHGTGDLNPLSGRIRNSFKIERQLSHHNNQPSILDLMPLIYHEREHRGICFDETTGNYLSNQQVGSALKKVCTGVLKGKKIDLLFCDACLMSSLGFAYEIKPWVNILVASQEVILATGYQYEQVLSKITQGNVSMDDFALHMVNVFKKNYSAVTNDFTLSAINTSALDPLYESINKIAQILIEALKRQKNGSVKEFIKKSGSRGACTSFNEPSYKDLNHLLKNFQQNIAMIEAIEPHMTTALRGALTQECIHASALIKKAVFANAAGKNLSQASGLSIYLPERRLHPSFQETNFAQNNSWLSLLRLYLAI